MTPMPASDKSTNVRIQESFASEDAMPALALALFVWAGLVGLGAFDGVFARLPLGVDLALAIFAAAFAAGSYALDASLRRAVDRVPFPALAAIALAADGALGISLTERPAELVHGVNALLAFFAAPVAFAAHLPAARAIARRFRREPARSPGASPAAT
jgi:hypothetical protein